MERVHRGEFRRIFYGQQQVRRLFECRDGACQDRTAGTPPGMPLSGQHIRLFTGSGSAAASAKGTGARQSGRIGSLTIRSRQTRLARSNCSAVRCLGNVSNRQPNHWNYHEFPQNERSNESSIGKPSYYSTLGQGTGPIRGKRFLTNQFGVTQRG